MARTLAVIGIIVIVAFLFILFFVTRPRPHESLELSVSNEQANVISAVSSQNGGYGTQTPTTPPYQAPKPPDSIATIRNLPNTSVFVSLMDQSGVATEIAPNGTYTFFVPTNAAFAASPYRSFAYLSADAKKRLAEYHIVSGKMISIEDVKSGNVTMMSRDPLNNNIFDTAWVSGNSHIVATYPAQNGIIYLTDIVLLPPEVRPFPF
jgi:uncharacterized surface protein with fasciclin (FAS1) repeats